MAEQAQSYGDDSLQWSEILMGILKNIANHMVAGSLNPQVRGVWVLSVFLDPYKDNDYFTEMEKINERYKVTNKKGKPHMDPDDSQDYHREWLTLMVNLISRSGFLPIRKIEAILDVRDLEGVQNV